MAMNKASESSEVTIRPSFAANHDNSCSLFVDDFKGSKSELDGSENKSDKSKTDSS